MDTSLFESYELDLQTLVASIQTKVATEAPALNGGKRKALLKRLEAELEEADEIIAQMEIEVQTADRDKPALQAKLKGYKGNINRSKGELKELASTADHDDLLSTNGIGHTSVDMEMERSDSPSLAQAQAQRTRLLSATDKLSDGQRRLEDSHRIALETEDLGGDILRDLRGQRDQLEHTRDGLYEADGTIDRASTTLKKMVRRMYQQKLVTYAIVAILILLM